MTYWRRDFRNLRKKCKQSEMEGLFLIWKNCFRQELWRMVSSILGILIFEKKKKYLYRVIDWVEKQWNFIVGLIRWFPLRKVWNSRGYWDLSNLLHEIWKDGKWLCHFLPLQCSSHCMKEIIKVELLDST